MKEPLFIRNNMYIQASPEKVWDALVNPEKTKHYMFGCVTVSTWQPGSSLDWQGQYQGKTMVFVTGQIKEITAPEKLVYTVFDPNNTEIPNVPENYLEVTYLLKQVGQGTELTVTQGDYNKVANGEKRYAESYNGGEGWNPILTGIKTLVEAE